jgi:hypothetical protein
VVDIAITILAPTLGFGLFALLAMRFGAESRPGFDGRPVKDDRPNLFPLPRSTPPPRTREHRGDDGHRIRTAPQRSAPAPRRSAPAAGALRRPAPGSAA